MEVKWIAVMAASMFGFLAVNSVFSEISEAKKVEACVSSQGQWVDIDKGFQVTMGCIR